MPGKFCKKPAKNGSLTQFFQTEKTLIFIGLQFKASIDALRRQKGSQMAGGKFKQLAIVGADLHIACTALIITCYLMRRYGKGKGVTHRP